MDEEPGGGTAGQRPPWWLWWVAAVVLLAVFCWQPGHFIALVQALAALGLVLWLLYVVVRYPDQCRELLRSMPGRVWRFETPWGTGTLGTPEQLKGMEERYRRLTGLQEQTGDDLAAQE